VPDSKKLARPKGKETRSPGQNGHVRESRKDPTNLSNTPIERVYTPDHLKRFDYERDMSLPGEYPFLRGVHATGYRGKLWTMRQFAGFGDAEDTNQRYKYLLKSGGAGLSVALDLPTLMGYDSDHPASKGEFGKCGVAVSSLRDMEVLFDGIALDKITTSMTINSPAAPIWAMYIIAAERKGIPMAALGGTLQNDILKEYIAQNEYIFPPEPSIKLVVDTVEFAARNMPKWNPISISGYHIREAGSTAVQELAFTLGDGFAYVDACLERGMKIDDFGPRLSFFFNVHNDFFEEIAKFRAARRIWARDMKEKYKAKNERTLWMRTHAQTAGCSLTAQQPEINVARVAIQALAAVLGGTQSLHTNSQDEALSLPTDKAALIALRTQQVIAHETGVANTVDPLGGSFYMEWLTNKMEDGAREYFRRVEDLGGVVACVESGFFVREIAEASFRYQQEVDRRERITVGVNDYVVEEPTSIQILKIDPKSERRQMQRLAQVRRERDNRETLKRLDELKRAARANQNVMPAMLDAVRAYATLGEICDVLREVYGVYQPAWAA